MRIRRPRALVLTALLAGLVLNGCDSSSKIVESDPTGGVVPDFALVDANPTSPRYNTSVSPRDYLTKVSGWYFGHAT